jgi:HSP20 family protein
MNISQGDQFKMMTMYVAPYRRKIARRGARDRVAEAARREKVLAVDVKSDDEAYTISALLPGIEAEEVNVEILEKTVSISGEFKDIEDSEEEKYLVSELPVGRFNRELTLPTSLEPSMAEANLKNGVFTLRVPKVEQDRPKVIKINTN